MSFGPVEVDSQSTAPSAGSACDLPLPGGGHLGGHAGPFLIGVSICSAFDNFRSSSLLCWMSFTAWRLGLTAIDSSGFAEVQPGWALEQFSSTSLLVFYVGSRAITWFIGYRFCGRDRVPVVVSGGYRERRI